MGIRFIYADESQRREIESRVEKLMISSLGSLLYAKLLGKEQATE
jgi:hypothetical protein